MENTNIKSDNDEIVDIPVPPFSSYEEILILYRKFIEGKVDSVPTHLGHLEEESAAIVNHLLKINSLGVLSIDSQPGSILQIQHTELMHRGEICNVTDLESKQRAYLECLLPKKLFKKLQKGLLSSEFILFYERISELGVEPEYIHHIPVTITSYLYGDKKYQLAETTLPVGIFLWGDSLDIIMSSTEDENKKNISKDMYSVRILDPIWGRLDYLFVKIIEVLSR